MVSANKEMVAYCFDTLVAYYLDGPLPSPAFHEGQHPLFVTWKILVDGELLLRGCIGTLEPTDLFEGMKDLALASALRDDRFPAIEATEIPYLECAVSALVDYQPAGSYLDWEIGKHGIEIEFIDAQNIRRHATFFPKVAAE